MIVNLYKHQDGFIGTMNEIKERYNINHSITKISQDIKKHKIPIEHYGYRTKRVLFRVVENGETKCEGMYGELCRKYNISSHTVDTFASINKNDPNRRKLKKKYDIYRVGLVIDDVQAKKPKKSLEDIYYEYAVDCLNEYGNTVVGNCAEEVLRRLEADGWQLHKQLIKRKTDEGIEQYYIVTDVR